jgi:hypothetical protein
MAFLKVNAIIETASSLLAELWSSYAGCILSEFLVFF